MAEYRKIRHDIFNGNGIIQVQILVENDKAMGQFKLDAELNGICLVSPAVGRLIERELIEVIK